MADSCRPVNELCSRRRSTKLLVAVYCY